MEHVNESSGPNVRHSNYILVENKIDCPHCSSSTAVFALALPAGYEALNPADGMPENHPEAWETIEIAAVLSYVEYLPDTVINRISSLTAHYRMGSEVTRRFWTNHCDQCQKAIEEEWLHEDFDGPFGLVGDDVSAAIQLHQVFEPFEALAGVQAHGVES